MEINTARIAASFYLGLDSAILKLLKKWSRDNGYSNYNKIEESKYITPSGLFYKNWGFDLEGVLL